MFLGTTDQTKKSNTKNNERKVPHMDSKHRSSHGSVNRGRVVGPLELRDGCYGGYFAVSRLRYSSL
jgi:hypothetical protein